MKLKKVMDKAKKFERASRRGGEDDSQDEEDERAMLVDGSGDSEGSGF